MIYRYLYLKALDSLFCLFVIGMYLCSKVRDTISFLNDGAMN